MTNNIRDLGDIPWIGGMLYDGATDTRVTIVESDDGHGELAVTMPREHLAELEREAERRGISVEQHIQDVLWTRFNADEGTGHDERP